MKYLKKLRGWIRLWIFSVCPACNSDAPEIDCCQICNGLNSIDSKTPWPWSKSTRLELWNIFRYVVTHRPQDL
jgi:hypothetical protein